MATYSDYIEQIVRQTYRLEGSLGSGGVNIGTSNEDRLQGVIASLKALVEMSAAARGTKP